MEINDYGSRLSATREQFNEKVKEIKKNHKNEVENLQNTHEYNEAKQAKTYKNQKQELEKDVKEFKDYHVSTSKDALDKLKKDFNNQMESTLRNHEIESRKNRIDFNTRLKDTRESYYNSKDLIENDFNNQLERVSKNYKDSLKRKTEKYNDDLRDVTEKNQANLQDFKNQATIEKRSLVSGIGEEVSRAIASVNEQRIQDREKLDKSLKRAQSSLKSSKEQMEKRIKEQMDAQRQKNTAKSQEVDGYYKAIVDDISDKHDANLKRIAHENNQKLIKVENDSIKEKKYLQKKLNSVIDNMRGGDSAQATLERTKTAYESRIKRLMAQNEQERVDSSIDKDRIMQIAQQNVRDQKDINQRVVDDMVAKQNKFVSDISDDFRLEKEKIVSQYRRQYDNAIAKGDNDLIQERAENRRHNENQKVEFARKISNLQEKNVETISELQRDIAREKSAFIEKTKRDVHNKTAQLREDMTGKLLKTVDSYEMKIQALENENKQIRSVYENTINKLKKKTVDELQTRSLLEQERKSESDRGFKRALLGKELENARVIQSIRQQFEKKLSGEKHNSDMMITKLTERYENQIKQLSREKDTLLKRKLSTARDHYERLAMANTVERQGLIDKYELEIQKLKDEVEKARELKRSDLYREASESQKA